MCYACGAIVPNARWRLGGVASVLGSFLEHAALQPRYVSIITGHFIINYGAALQVGRHPLIHGYMRRVGNIVGELLGTLQCAVKDECPYDRSLGRQAAIAFDECQAGYLPM